MALSPSLRAQLTALADRRGMTELVASSPLRMQFASPEEHRVNDALGALSFLSGQTGGGTPDTGGAALGPVPDGLGGVTLGDAALAASFGGGAGVGGGTPPDLTTLLAPGGALYNALAAPQYAAERQARRADQQAVSGTPGGGDAGEGAPGTAGDAGTNPGPSPAQVASFGQIGVSPISTSIPSLAGRVAGLAGAPALAAGLGILGGGLGAFQGAVGLAGKLADALGIPTSHTGMQGVSQGLTAAQVQDPELGMSLTGNQAAGLAALAGLPSLQAAMAGLAPGQGLNLSLQEAALLQQNPSLNTGNLTFYAGPNGYVGLSPTQHEINSQPFSLPRSNMFDLNPRGVEDPQGPPPGLPSPNPDEGMSNNEGGSGTGPSGGVGNASDSGAPSGGDNGDRLGGVVPDTRPGGGDDEPRMLTGGEYVVRKASSDKYRPLLHAINQDQPKQISRLAKALVG